MPSKQSIGTFNKFKDSVQVSRFETRWITHILDLTGLQPGKVTYVTQEEQKPNWLILLFEALPNIRCFLADSMYPFIDARLVMLMSLNQTFDDYSSLRMLRLTGTPFTPTRGLQFLVPTACCLTYLDLSYTEAAKNAQFLQFFASEATFRSIGVLKLQHVGLGDDDLEHIAKALGTKLWSLDVTGNILTDYSVTVLLEFCFKPPEYLAPPDYNPRFVIPRDPIDEDSEATIMEGLSKDSGATGQRDTGLTHLYISDNYLRIESMVKLIQTSRLLVFDCDRDPDLDGCYATSPHICSRWFLAQFCQPSPVNSLRYLRVHCSFIGSGNEWFPRHSMQEPSLHALDEVMQNREYHTENWSKDELDAALPKKTIPVVGIRELVLANVPAMSSTPDIAKGIAALIEQCAAIEASDPPRKTALRKIILEINGQPDPECFNLIEIASQNDFSFFAPEGADEVTPTVRPPADPWCGDVIEILKTHIRELEHQWSGDVCWFQVHESDDTV